MVQLPSKDIQSILKRKEQLVANRRAANDRQQKDLRQKGSLAYRRTIEWLISENQEAFDQRLGDEREKVGLPRVKAPKKSPSRLAILREQLEAAGIRPKV